MRERRNYLLLIGLIVALAIGAALIAVPGSPLYKKPTLGLDLRGGLEVILKAVPKRGETINPTQMNTARDIMVNRVDKIGVASPNVATQGTDQIVIQLAGIHDPAKAAAIVGSTGQLQFFDFEEDLRAPTVTGGNPTPYPTLYALLNDPTVKREASKGTPEEYHLFGNKPKIIHTTDVDGKKITKTIKNPRLGHAPTREQLLAPFHGKQPADTTILAVPAKREAVSGPIATTSTQPVKVSPNGRYWYLFKVPPAFGGSDLKESEISAGADPDTGKPEVTLGFNGHGAREFQRITKAEYDRGQVVAGVNNSAGTYNDAFAQHNAIVLDNQIKAVPYIDYTDNRLSLGIAGGHAVISNMESTKAASDLALVLQSGSLPYTFERLSETEVSATLGKSSLHEALIAAIAGLLRSRFSCSCSTGSSDSLPWSASRSTRSSTTRRSSCSTSR